MQETIPVITVNELQQYIADGAVLVDVREPDETASGVIPDAKLIPLSQFPETCCEIPKAKTIIFYCRSGRRSLKAGAIASQWIDSKLYSLAGGYEEYKQKFLLNQSSERQK